MIRSVPATPIDGQDALDLIVYLERDSTPEEIAHAKKWEKIVENIIYF